MTKRTTPEERREQAERRRERQAQRERDWAAIEEKLARTEAMLAYLTRNEPVPFTGTTGGNDTTRNIATGNVVRLRPRSRTTERPL